MVKVIRVDTITIFDCFAKNFPNKKEIAWIGFVHHSLLQILQALRLFKIKKMKLCFSKPLLLAPTWVT